MHHEGVRVSTLQRASQVDPDTAIRKRPRWDSHSIDLSRPKGAPEQSATTRARQVISPSISRPTTTSLHVQIRAEGYSAWRRMRSSILRSTDTSELPASKAAHIHAHRAPRRPSRTRGFAG